MSSTRKERRKRYSASPLQRRLTSVIQVALKCFSFPALGTLGNLGRNTLRAPGLEGFDFSLFKNHNLLGEQMKVQFRAEAFNLLNRANFGARVASLINGRGAYVPGNAALKAPTVTTSRQIQFGTKLIW